RIDSPSSKISACAAADSFGAARNAFRIFWQAEVTVLNCDLSTSKVACLRLRCTSRRVPASPSGKLALANVRLVGRLGRIVWRNSYADSHKRLRKRDAPATPASDHSNVIS